MAYQIFKNITEEETQESHVISTVNFSTFLKSSLVQANRIINHNAKLLWTTITIWQKSTIFVSRHTVDHSTVVPFFMHPHLDSFIISYLQGSRLTITFYWKGFQKESLKSGPLYWVITEGHATELGTVQSQSDLLLPQDLTKGVIVFCIFKPFLKRWGFRGNPQINHTVLLICYLSHRKLWYR